MNNINEHLVWLRYSYVNTYQIKLDLCAIVIFGPYEMYMPEHFDYAKSRDLLKSVNVVYDTNIVYIQRKLLLDTA